jgi:hypothetical protein
MPSPGREILFVSLVAAALGLLHYARRLFWLFSLLVLPGTLAHELCHLLLGLLLRGRPAHFSLLPHREGHGWVMGSVGFTHLRWYNAFFIGMAPLLLLPAAYGLLLWRLGGNPQPGWEEALAIYVIANLVYAAVPSGQDLRLAARSPIGWLVLAGLLGWGWSRVQGRGRALLPGTGAAVRQGGPGQK